MMSARNLECSALTESSPRTRNDADVAAAVQVESAWNKEYGGLTITQAGTGRIGIVMQSAEIRRTSEFWQIIKGMWLARRRRHFYECYM